MKLNIKTAIATLVVAAPFTAFAQGAITDVNSLTYKLTNLGNTAIVVLIAFAVIWIIFNVVRFIISDEENRGKYRTSVLWGIVGLFVILSIWGLVKILTNTFRTDTTTPVNQFPTVNYPPATP